MVGELFEFVWIWFLWFYLNSSLNNKSDNGHTHLYPLGFNGHLNSSDCGNTLGTHVTGWDIDGCAVAFRRDNPSEGKLSMKIDGYIYQNEGTYRCLDTSNFSYSNGTLTITM